MLFSGPCYLARCDLITERVLTYVKWIHCTYQTQRTKKKKKLTSDQHKHNVLKVKKQNKNKTYLSCQTTVPIYAMYTMRHKPYRKGHMP